MTAAPDRSRATTSYRDPASMLLQGATGLSQRQIVNACKRAGWPWRKVYGRIWVCADFEQRWAESSENPKRVSNL